MSAYVIRIVIKGIALLLLMGVVGFGVFIGGYSVLRAIRISANWITWIIGTLIIIGSIVFCILLLIPNSGPAALAAGNIPSDHRLNYLLANPTSIFVILLPSNSPGLYSNGLGALSVVVAAYATSQWLARKWFVGIKKRATTFLVQQSRNFLLFARKQHQFFGWLAVIAAAAHMLGYLSLLFFFNQSYEIITGFIALGILALMAVLGTWMWVESSLRKRVPLKIVKTIHSSLTIAFVVALIVHI